MISPCRHGLRTINLSGKPARYRDLPSRPLPIHVYMGTFSHNKGGNKTAYPARPHWIAISVYVLVAIIKKRLKLDASLYTLLQILSVTIFEKTTIQQALWVE